MSKVEESEEYKTELLEEFVFMNHYLLYFRTNGRYLYIGDTNYGGYSFGIATRSIGQRR